MSQNLEFFYRSSSRVEIGRVMFVNNGETSKTLPGCNTSLKKLWICVRRNKCVSVDAGHL